MSTPAERLQDASAGQWYPGFYTDLRTVLCQHAKLLDALRLAQSGLAWYQERFPQATDGSDEDCMVEIQAAIDAASGESCPR